MDRAFLAMAERHVAAGQRRITKQRRIIADLDELGADTELAKHILATFLEAQRQYERDRQRIAIELIKLGA